MSDGGKGSAPRPLSVDRDTFADNWANTFKKPPEIDTFSEEFDDDDALCPLCGGPMSTRPHWKYYQCDDCGRRQNTPEEEP